MELLKTEYSQSKGIGKLDKVSFKCVEPDYYHLTDLLYTSQNEQALILKALYESNINLVLKFGLLESIEKEYEIGQELLEIPNFIRYFCVIKCNDNIRNIINFKHNISNYKMCHYGDKVVGILVMKEYNLGCVENYNWNVDNIDLLKNVIKQVIFSILLAYDTKEFIHGDLHTGNVLLKSKRNLEIKYNNKTLVLEDFEVVIMDFEKSKLNQKNKTNILINNILKFITSIISTCLKNNLVFNIDIGKINKLKSFLNENIDYYNELEKIIDDVIIQ